MDRSSPAPDGTPWFKNIHLAACLVVVALAGLYFALGYQVYVSDQTIYLLLPFRSLFADFCPQDWFIWHTSHFHYVFAYCIRLLYVVSAGHLETGMFVVWCVCWLVCIVSIYHIVIATGGTWTEFCLVCLLLFFYASTSLGDSVLFTNILVPSFMGCSLTLAATALLLSSRIMWSFGVLGLATLLHINYGVIGFPVFLLWTVLNIGELKIKTITLASLLFFVIASPVIISTLLAFGTTNDTLLLAYNLRGPHHYVPSAFGWREIATTLVPLLMAFFIICKYPALRHRPLTIFLSILAGLFIGVFFMTLPAQSVFIKKLYAWRLAPFMLLASYIVLARGLSGPTRRRALVVMAGIATALLLIANYGLQMGMIRWLCLIVPAAGCVLIGTRYAQQPLRQLWLGTGMVVVALWVGSVTSWHHQRVLAAEIIVHPHHQLWTWLRANTPADALFLIPPEMEGIQAAAHRAAVVNFKSVPQGIGSQMQEWKRRMEIISNTPQLEHVGLAGAQLGQELDRRYAALTPNYVRMVMDTFKADYCITYSHAPQTAFAAAGFTLRYADQRYLVYQPPASLSSTAGAPTATVPDTAGYTAP